MTGPVFVVDYRKTDSGSYVAIKISAVWQSTAAESSKDFSKGLDATVNCGSPM